MNVWSENAIISYDFQITKKHVSFEKSYKAVKEKAKNRNNQQSQK